MDGEIPSEPDSTTVEKELAVRDFAVNDDVLCHISRAEQLYLGVVVQVNHVLKKCLVKFLDNTETWCCFSDMKFFSLGEQEVTCVVCKSTQPSLGNQLRVCACGRGYHQRCHQPHIQPRDSNWKCRICSPAPRRELCERPAKQLVLLSTSVSQKLEQQQQCLKCGKNDTWHRGMIQCRRCRQWFHGNCLNLQQPPVLNGDRFYVLVCSSCNRGRQLCCRLALSWSNLVHLTLYNLNLIHHTKYHDLDDSIMPLLHRVWNDLQIPTEMANIPVAKRRHHVEAALQSCSKRFRCGREAKKRVTLWGLVNRGAPRPPPISLPSRGPVDEHILSIRKLLLHPTEQPLQNGFINSSKKEEDYTTRKATDGSGSSSPTSITLFDVKVESSTEFHGRGLVKRSVPFPVTEAANSADARFRSHAVRRAARLLRQRVKKPQQQTTRLSDSEDEALRTLFRATAYSGTNSISKIDEKETKKEVRKRPRRNLLEARLNSTESKLYNPQAAATTTPTESPVKKKIKKNENLKTTGGRLKPKRKLVQKTILETLQTKKHRVDAADEDSNSSADERVLPIKTVITKRQLSEKDIVVDRNGVVRRRRRPHRRPPLPVLPSKPPPVVTAPLPLSITSLSFSTGPIDMALVKELLGPLPRVERGEQYRVTSKRILANGEEEVLIDFPKPGPS